MVYMSFGIHTIPLLHEYGRTLHDNFHHFVGLQEIIGATYESWKGCGTYLMGPESLDYDPRTYNKQALLYDTAKGADHVLEIGVHAGHSLLIMLLANPRLRIVCIDICEWDHPPKCVEYLNAALGNRITFIKGSSVDVLPQLTATYDFIHVDGDHGADSVDIEANECHRLSSPSTVFVFDDFDSGVAQGLQRHADKFRVVFAPQCAWRNCLVVRSDRETLEN